MKKELNYLSLPDHFNKYLLINYNQKLKTSDNIFLQLKLSNNYHLGSALKAIYLLEIIFPRKSFIFKLKLKQKKLYFGQKSKNNVFFQFMLNLTILEFIEFFRFFSKKPISLKKSSLDNLSIINRKLKQFDFNTKIHFTKKDLSSSFFFIKNYHLN